MKIAGIIFIALIGLSLINRMGSQSAVKGMAAILDNANNQQGMALGQASDFQKSYETYKQLTREELLVIIENERLNLHQASNVLVVLADTYFKERNFAEGMKYCLPAAEIYHHPIAQAVLAKAYFRGIKDPNGGEALAFPRDREKAFYLVNRSFQTAGVMHELTGEKFALDRSVGLALGVLDSYNVSTVRKELDYEKLEAEVTVKVAEDVADYKKMYSL